MDKKSPDAFRTISEVADWLGVPTHVLRFWESRFSQVKPVKRAGGRRYYRPTDMELLGGIRRLLHDDGLTIRGVQKLLRDRGVKYVASMSPPLDSDEMRDVTPSNVVPLAKGQTGQPDRQTSVDRAVDDRQPAQSVNTDPPQNTPPDQDPTATQAAKQTAQDQAQPAADHPADHAAAPPVRSEPPQPDPVVQQPFEPASEHVPPPAAPQIPAQPQPEAAPLPEAINSLRTPDETDAGAQIEAQADLLDTPSDDPLTAQPQAPTPHSPPPNTDPQPDMFGDDIGAAQPQTAQPQADQHHAPAEDATDPLSDTLSNPLPDPGIHSTDAPPQEIITALPPDPGASFKDEPAPSAPTPADPPPQHPPQPDNAVSPAVSPPQTAQMGDIADPAQAAHENPPVFGTAREDDRGTGSDRQDPTQGAAALLPPTPSPLPDMAQPAPAPAALADISHIPADPDDDAATDAGHPALLGQLQQARQANTAPDPARLRSLHARLEALGTRMPAPPQTR